MPHGKRAAIMLVVGASAVAASIPAPGQTRDRFGSPLPGDNPWSPSGGLGRPSPPLPRFEEPRRDLPPSASPWSSPSPWSVAPTPGTGAWTGAITQRQAMELLAAAGFTDVHPPEPNLDGSWTGLASRQGRTVRATVDPQGNISTR